MDQDKEVTEGQTIAKAILDGEANAWELFQLCFGDAISRIASKRAKSFSLQAEFSAEDIIHGFIAEKLLMQPEKIFGPVASGDRPLTPRLLRSLVNYCNSLNRRRKSTVHSDKSLEKHRDKQSNEDPDYYPHETAVLIKKRVEDQQKLIREAFAVSSRIRVPQREILLLSERILFAEQFVLGYCNEHQSSIEWDAAKVSVATLYAWTDKEAATLIPMANDALSTIWETISRSLFTPPFGADGFAIAEIIQVPRNTWDIWVRRARQRLILHAGVQKSKGLFPNWPQRLFDSENFTIGQGKGEQKQ